MLAESTTFNQYIDGIRQEIIDARSKAFKSVSMLPHAEVFNDIMEYNSKSVGKLLRPCLCAMFCDALGGPHSEGIHLGASMELVHSGSLVHDDIIDNDMFRRGMSTIHEQFSVKSAILFGDMLFVASAASVRTLPDHHMSLSFKELMDTYGRASSGAMRENNRNPFDKDEYLDVIKLKTASLFRASARLGAISADATNDTVSLIGDYGEKIGMAFQIMDDIIDIQKSIDEDVPLGDVKEGKTSYPIIYLYNKYPDLLKECEIYADGVKDTRNVKNLFNKMPEGILESHVFIKQLVEDSNNLLDQIPFKDYYLDLLKQYGHYAINSMRKEMNT
jgi:geranylgeranyl pyrophosphate synthase